MEKGGGEGGFSRGSYLPFPSLPFPVLCFLFFSPLPFRFFTLWNVLVLVLVLMWWHGWMDWTWREGERGGVEKVR